MPCQCAAEGASDESVVAKRLAVPVVVPYTILNSTRFVGAAAAAAAAAASPSFASSRAVALFFVARVKQSAARRIANTITVCNTVSQPPVAVTVLSSIVN